MVKWLRYLLIGFILLLAVLFVLDNHQPVVLSFHLFSVSLEAPLFFWLWSSLILGMVLAALLLITKQVSDMRAIINQTKEIQALRAEVDALKCEARMKNSFQEE